MNERIQELVKLSQYAGKHPDLVQGGGGNCSVKAGGKMLIKSSGCFLEQVRMDQGYVVIDLSSGKKIGGPGERPSLETNFHALLGTYVIHTHPIVVGALVCAKEGESIVRELFPEQNSLWVPYARPGEPLASVIQTTLNTQALAGDLRFFFQNHGLTVSAETLERAIELHEQTLGVIGSYFGKNAMLGKSGLLSRIPANEYLTPDHVIYSNLSSKDLKPKERAATVEMRTFASTVLAMMKQRGFTPQYLPEPEVSSLLALESEHYRQNLLREPQ